MNFGEILVFYAVAVSKGIKITVVMLRKETNEAAVSGNTRNNRAGWAS